MQPDKNTQLWMYDRMFKNRVFEQTLEKVYMEGKTPKFDLAKGIFPGEFHISSGQEPSAVGMLAHLNKDDWCGVAHRSHHVAIARDVDGPKMTAEILGKKTGLCGGYGGHMHLFDKDKKFSTTGIIGEGLPLALGAALSFKKRGRDNVAVTYLGDGAVNQGAFHETMNLAAVWNLPLIAIIEDNGWAVSVPTSLSTAVKSNAERAGSYNIPGVLVETNDPLDIYEAAGEAVNRARNGQGPSLIEIRTIRLEGHFMGDAQQYRTPEEMDTINKNDPIPLFRQRLLENALATADELDLLEKDIRTEVDSWVQFARESAYPEPEDALKMVFSE